MMMFYIIVSREVRNEKIKGTKRQREIIVVCELRQIICGIWSRIPCGEGRKTIGTGFPEFFRSQNRQRGIDGS
jgi:hypothetical protein